MRVGIVILPELSWSRARERWQRAELYGFDHAWTYDHLGWRDLVDGPWFDAVATLTAAATATSTIRLGTCVASPNFRHPVHLAREVTALDDISGGRFVLGVGAGGAGFDATVLGADPLPARLRVDRFAEFLELLDALLRTDRVTWHGSHYTAVDARSTPGCVQAPRVPFVVAANGPRSIRLAARYGQGWITTGGVTGGGAGTAAGNAAGSAAGASAGTAVGRATGAAADDPRAWWRSVDEARQRLDEALAEAGREPSEMDRYLSLDSGPMYSLSSVDAFTDALGRAADLGFTDVITHWPRPSGWYAGDESVLEAIAADVLAARPTGAAAPAGPAGRAV